MSNPSHGIHSAHYPRTYAASRGWKVFFWILCLFLGIPSILGLWYFGTGHDVATPRAKWMMEGICAAFAALSAYLLTWVIRYQITLDSDSIETRELLGTKRALRSDLHGWRILPNTPPILVLTRKTKKRPLKLALIFTVDDPFSDWLDPLTDLDSEVVQTSATDILENPALGATEEERAAAFARGRKLGKTANAVAWAVSLWGWFYPRPYELSIVVLLAVPWLTLLIVSRSKGLFRIDELRNDVHPSVAIAFTMPGIILLLRGVTAYAVLDWDRLLLFGVIGGAVLLFAAARADRFLRQSKYMLLIFFVLTFCYGLGGATLMNEVLDKSPAKLYPAKILDKNVVRNKHISFLLKLDAWGPQPAGNSVDVPKEMYDFVKVGDTVCVSVKPGALGAAWYDVFGCP